MLDRELITRSPLIDFEENPNGIGGGNGAQITGIDNLSEAKNIALVLQTGALPVEFRTLSDTTSRPRSAPTRSRRPSAPRSSA